MVPSSFHRPLTKLRNLLVLVPALVAACWPTAAHADALPGLLAVGYTIDEVPPIRSDVEYPTCGNEVENNINRNFNGEPFQQCGNDLFMIHYTGYITIPENDTIEFMVAADDGGTIQIGGTEFGTWNDKGCSWSEQTTESFPAGVYPLDGWFYEHGGGTCYMLAWNIDDEGWEIVPDDAFTQTSTPVTTTTTTTSTTTTVPETTVPQTTTTLPETTTTTTTLPEVVTTTSSTSTTTTTTTQAPPPLTTTTTEPEPTTTTTEPEPTTTTEPEPTTTTTEPEPEETTTTTEPEPEPTTTTTEPEPEETTTTTEPEEEPTPTTVLQVTPQISVAEAVAVIYTQPLEELPAEQLVQVFEAIVEEELTTEQGEAITAILNEATDEVKKVFQEEVNVFAGIFDSYRMVGQTIDVGQRRTLIAVANSLVAVGPALRRRK